MADQEKQCRICFDGVDAEKELGRLIRPCLCKGSISFVHIECLQTWRNASTSNSAFFQCPQCHYQYRFARTNIVGLAKNSLIIGVLSALLFTLIVLMASYITTFFMSPFEDPTYNDSPYYGFLFISPYEVARDLIKAAFRVIRDGELSGVFEESASYTNTRGSIKVPVARASPGIISRFIRRFLLGLPLVGAGSLVQMLVSFQTLAPVQMIARYRGSRSRRSSNNSRDIAALIVISLLLVGAFRALYKVYKFTERLTKRALVRAEESILEVN